MRDENEMESSEKIRTWVRWCWAGLQNSILVAKDIGSYGFIKNFKSNINFIRINIIPTTTHPCNIDKLRLLYFSSPSYFSCFFRVLIFYIAILRHHFRYIKTEFSVFCPPYCYWNVFHFRYIKTHFNLHNPTTFTLLVWFRKLAYPFL